MPFGVAFDRTGRKAYVTQWMGRAVSVVDTATETAVKQIGLSPAHRVDLPSQRVKHLLAFDELRGKVLVPTGPERIGSF